MGYIQEGRPQLRPCLKAMRWYLLLDQAFEGELIRLAPTDKRGSPFPGAHRRVKQFRELVYDHREKLVERTTARHEKRKHEYNTADLNGLVKWAALELQQRRDYPAVATEKVKNLNRLLGILHSEQPRRDPNGAIYKFDSEQWKDLMRRAQVIFGPEDAAAFKEGQALGTNEDAVSLRSRGRAL